MTKTAAQAGPEDRSALEELNFLERALERTLAALDADASLTDAERSATKAALASALAPALRGVRAAAPPARPLPTEMISFDPAPAPDTAPVQDRPGYFRQPPEPIGMAEGDGKAGEVRLTGGKATWLRVMPRDDPGRSWTCTAIRTAMLRAGKTVLPIFSPAQGIGHVRAADGFGTYSPVPSATESAGVAFCFRSGEIWAVDTYVQDALGEQRPSSAIMTLQPQLTAAFESYVSLLERLGAPKPYRWVIGMDGLLGRSLSLPQGARAGFPRGYCGQDTVEVAGEYDGSQPMSRAIQPFFDELYEACGVPVS